jgi:hypothetical protein
VSDSSKPEPLYAAVQRPRCPVCGEATYSRSGIHPQCAQERGDALQKKRLKERQVDAPPPAPPAVNPNQLRPWHKRCPGCRAEIHVRRNECDCGYEFPRTRAETADGRMTDDGR